jgi:hypothetical protein
MTEGGYLDSPWPGEDAGPARLQAPRSGTAGLNVRPGEKLRWVTRNTWMSTLTVLGAPGEVYLLTHSVLRARLGFPTTSRVEQIDPITLKTLRRSPRLPSGPMWPGGMAIHRNGDLYVVYGRWAHRLSRACVALASLRLPIDQPYNSFVILDNGLIVTKNLSDQTCAHLTVIDAETLQPACPDRDCPEPSIARLSASGNTVYVVGVRSIFRYHWDATSLTGWSSTTTGDSTTSDRPPRPMAGTWCSTARTPGSWTTAGTTMSIKMIGSGLNSTPNRLIRVSLNDARDHQILPVSGIAGGSITNPPLVDLQRRIVLAYDSANRYLRAWRFEAQGTTLKPLWEKSPFGCASHMILYPDTGEVVVNDYRRHGEEVVVLAIESGRELARVRTGGLTQGVVFPSAGWGRDFYWSSMGRLARVFVQ